MGKIIISMDVERDLPGHIKNSELGIENINKFFDVFDSYKITCDFFVCADICNKFEDLIKEMQKNHNLGNHGLSHDFLCKLNYQQQYDDIASSTEIIRSITNKTPTMFRAPNFAINQDTIEVLRKLKYEIDSSVMPGRIMKKIRYDPFLYKHLSTFNLYDFREANRIPNLTSENIIEVPLSEDPFNPGRPIGMGCLNTFGIDRTMKAIAQIKEPYVIFLIHPWEALDLGKHYPNLPEGYKAACDGNLTNFQQLMEQLHTEEYTFSTVVDVADDHKGESG
jgi:peptidoglycan/xylan/chitin deacetylase (PgdA/CDA1 family)